METIYSNITECRVCSHSSLFDVHDFGEIPLADKLTDTPDAPVPSANLSVVFCTNCHHLQIRENVNPEELFKFEYAYYSSKIPEVVRHFKGTYERIMEKIEVGPDDIVAELASNDGTLIRNFEPHTKNLVCIEPSLDHARITEALGYRTYPVFFNDEEGKRIRKELPKGAKLIMANNVLAHVPDPQIFAGGIAHLLSDDGVAVIEVPHTYNMIRNCTFDVIFHQHYSYFNLHALRRLFAAKGLTIFDIDKIDTQGGTLRLYIGRDATPAPIVQQILDEEVAAGLLDTATYTKFSERIDASRAKLMTFVRKAHGEGKKVAGYGAPGKAATLLNYFGIDRELFEYLVDISDNKHHKFFPFTGLEIMPLDVLEKDPPEYIVILAWNYAPTIIRSLSHLKEKGTTFVIPYPDLQFV